MKCPYCVSDINDAAIVCPVCRRDLYLFKPLQEKIADLEKQLKEADSARQPQPEARVAEPGVKPGNDEIAVSAPATTALPGKPKNYLLNALITALITLALLLAAHALIVILYDLKTLYLRIASLLIPLPFGFVLYTWHPRRFWHSSAIALVVACLAVLGMSALTGHIDKVPVLPKNLLEWREFIEYAASLTFSFITGLLFGKVRYHRSRKTAHSNPLVIWIAQLFAKDSEGELGLQKLITRINNLTRALAPLATGATALYTGIKAVLGD